MVAPNHETLAFIGSLRSLSGDKSRCLSMASSSAKPGSPVSLNPCWMEAAASGNSNRRSGTAGHDEQRFIATRDGRIAGSTFPSTTVCVSIGNELPRASQQRTGSRKTGYTAVAVALAKCQPKDNPGHRFRWMALPQAVPEDHGIQSTAGTGRSHHTQVLGLLVAKHSEDDEDRNPLALSSATCLGCVGNRNSIYVGWDALFAVVFCQRPVDTVLVVMSVISEGTMAEPNRFYWAHVTLPMKTCYGPKSSQWSTSAIKIFQPGTSKCHGAFATPCTLVA